jgi:hypothetical protein
LIKTNDNVDFDTVFDKALGVGAEDVEMVDEEHVGVGLLAK